MKLERLETPGIAHYAYLLSDGREAAVVDPSRETERYLEAARSGGVRIRWILETHRHEDFVMGSSDLARATGGQIVNLDHELFGHGDLRLSAGDTVPLGDLLICARHTPGHTPESTSYAVYTERDRERAWCVFTGDTLFFGDTGRTDLPDPERAAENAALLYDSVHREIAPLGDTALVLPAHGPGSVCGSGMEDRPYSTLGEEKRYNAVFRLGRDAFARRKGGERIPRPPYFRLMEEVNLGGGLPPALSPGQVPLLDVETFAASCSEARVLDTREPEGFAGGHVPRSYNVWMGGLPVFGGWLASADTPVLLVTDAERDVDEAVRHLTRIGVDRIEGALAGGFGAWRKSGNAIATSGVLTPRELAEALDSFQVLDVREPDEFDAGHIPGAHALYVGYVEERLGKLDLDPERPLAVTCGVGHRAGLAVSMLLRHGFRDVRNLLGGMTAWSRLDLPLTT